MRWRAIDLAGPVPSDPRPSFAPTTTCVRPRSRAITRLGISHPWVLVARRTRPAAVVLRLMMLKTVAVVPSAIAVV